MKKLPVLIIALPFLLIAATAFGQTNVEGVWEVQQTCMGSVVDSDPASPFFVLFNSQEPATGLFTVENCGGDPGKDCYGVVYGKELRVTCWDNVIVGTETKKGLQYRFVSHKQFPEDKESATCIGTVTKVFNEISCP